MNSAAEWVASVPELLTARDALSLIDTALGDAKQAADEIAARFHGTLPPPPWPRHKELVRAVEALEGGRKMLVTIIEQLGNGDVQRDRNDPQVIRLLNAGRALYAEIAEMQKRMQGVKVEELPAMAAAAAARFASNKIGGLITFSVVLWLLKEFADE